MNSEETGKRIAATLLEIGAIKLNLKKPFQWSSGWFSPIYCDNRLSLSHPKERTFIKEELSSLASSQFPDVEAIAGVATAGIPQGALVADHLNLPFVYVRSKPKGHGMENLIEGKVTEGQKIVVVEDLISTGGSSLKAVEALRKARFEVVGLVAIFTYGFPIAEKNFEEADVKYSCLSNYNYLLEQALAIGTVNEDQLVSLKAWRVDPENWKP